MLINTYSGWEEAKHYGLQFIDGCIPMSLLGGLSSDSGLHTVCVCVGGGGIIARELNKEVKLQTLVINGYVYQRP